MNRARNRSGAVSGAKRGAQPIRRDHRIALSLVYREEPAGNCSAGVWEAVDPRTRLSCAWRRVRG